MNRIGFHASHEQWHPEKLLRHLQRAQEIGFQDAMCSDHFHPWSERSDSCGHTWSWLGAALQSTQFTFGTVCAPGQRYHPAIIAQASATLARMYPERFWIALGSGEALNEHITGQEWPSKEERQLRLKESADVIRRLWRGETVDFRGTVNVEGAKLFSAPRTPPLIYGAAITPETAAWVASWADGMITVSQDPEKLRKVVDAFRRNGGAGKPMMLQAVHSYARDPEVALEDAFQRWRFPVLESQLLEDTESPATFDELTKNTTREEIAKRLRISSSVEQHLAFLTEDFELGFDRVYVHNVSKEMDAFFEDLAPAMLSELGTA
jgi:coenzyme F420-dependent glucose-6-phosphate dehydrogenase